MNKMLPSTLLLALLLSPLLLTANEFTYEARVLRADPVTTTTTTHAMPDTCFSAPPSDFERRLAWDLGCDQPRSEEIDAWQVSYQVGSSTFTAITIAEPGDYLPVRINFNPLNGALLAPHPPER